MGKFQLTTAEKMLFALLRGALHSQTPDVAQFEGVAPAEWLKCCQTAVSQGVVILAWDGVALLPSRVQPPQDLKISWAMAAEKYEKKYECYCRATSELFSLYEKESIEMVQLKGVGLSTYYSIPSHREGGDIDIYTKSADVSRYSDAEANQRANELIEAQGIEVDYEHPKHSHFRYMGIPVENHKHFLDIERCPLSAQIEDLLHRHLSPESATLPTGESILIPSPQFNTLFVAMHAFQHFGCGLALHHLYDWACILKRYGLMIPAEITDGYFLEGIAALTRLCNQYLGLSIPVQGGEKLAQEMLKSMLYPFSAEDVPSAGFFRIVKYKSRRFYHDVYSRNRILHIPLWRNSYFWNKLWNSVFSNLTSPKRIMLVEENEEQTAI